MFEIDVAGLAELEGGKPAHRIAFEPVANVFDEYRGYDESRRKPSFCAVTLEHSSNPRGVWLTVADDGAGFANERDIWTLFGSTSKRGAAGVAGRFNAGDKQLVAVARESVIKTNSVTVEFSAGERNVTRHRSPVVNGTIIRALMPWSLSDLEAVRSELIAIRAPDGLRYTVDGRAVDAGKPKHSVTVTLPTVILTDGVMRTSNRKSRVEVIESTTPTLYELGMPVCSLAEVGFPWSLDVAQKVPVPMSRDQVTPAYLFRMIGSVVEAAAMDGVRLLSEDQQGAGFLKDALDWVREPAALAEAVKHVYGENAVRATADPIANAQAAASGAMLVSGRWLTSDTRKRLDDVRALPTSIQKFGGSEAMKRAAEEAMAGTKKCPTCGGAGRVAE